MIIAGVSWFPMAFLPGKNILYLFMSCYNSPISETYGPTILKKRAQKLRKSTGNINIVAPVDIEAKSYREFIIASLARPLRMLVSEPLVYLNCLYIAILYAFFYLFFQAYPIIFQGKQPVPLQRHDQV